MSVTQQHARWRHRTDRTVRRANMPYRARILSVIAITCGATLLAQEPYPAQQQPYPPAQQYPQQNYPAQQNYPPPQYPQQQEYPQQQQYPPQQYPAYNQPQYTYQPQAPTLPPQQIDSLVQRIALYPDPLLAQVLTASTFWQEIPDAATWSQEHAYLHGDQLAQAIQQDNLPWDPSVVALLPFPQVLDTMARDMGWTQQLGNAVLVQRQDVMDAVQRMRQEAMNYGYLQNTQYDRVVNGGPGDIEILPVNPGYIYVPYYNPGVVFVRPRAGFYVGGAINWGPGIYLGGAFAPWGWGHPVFGWRSHDIVIDGRPWGRTWVNRGGYVHPYEHSWVRPAAPRIERHEFHGGNERGSYRDHAEHENREHGD